jgi:hypothetical protein
LPWKIAAISVLRDQSVKKCHERQTLPENLAPIILIRL